MKKDSPAGRYFARGILDPECLTAGGIVAIHEGQHTIDPATGERHTGVDVSALTDALRESSRLALAPGAGTEAMERHLWASAMLLQNLAVVWTTYATRAECTEQLDLYARLALKAQNQQRQTLRTLAEIRNPRRATFIRQQNQAVNQQVFNSPVAAETGKIRDLTTSEVLGLGVDDERVDFRAPTLAVGHDANLATVGAFDRPANDRGESQDPP